MEPKLDQDKQMPYTPPQLSVFGDIRRITQSKGKKGSMDTGGSSPNTKTSA
jgi:hypothetical protein